jgi:hypothetical protein
MKEPFHPVIRSQADLEALWKKLMGPGGFGGHSLWMLLIDDEIALPQITEITDAIDPPDDDMVASLATVLRGLAGEGRRFAFLRSRPGHGGLTADDRAWARSLYDAGRLADVPLEVVHRASNHDLVAVPMDEVA